MLGVKFILKGSSSVNHAVSNEGRKKDLQLPDHRENRSIRIGRLAHKAVGGIEAADDNDVQTEDLDVHDITCCMMYV